MKVNQIIRALELMPADAEAYIDHQIQNGDKNLFGAKKVEYVQYILNADESGTTHEVTFVYKADFEKVYHESGADPISVPATFGIDFSSLPDFSADVVDGTIRKR